MAKKIKSEWIRMKPAAESIVFIRSGLCCRVKVHCAVWRLALSLYTEVQKKKNQSYSLFPVSPLFPPPFVSVTSDEKHLKFEGKKKEKESFYFVSRPSKSICSRSTCTHHHTSGVEPERENEKCGPQLGGGRRCWCQYRRKFGSS